MSAIITQMGILFFAILLGFAGAKCGVINADSNKHLSNIVLNLTLPCSILYSVLSNERTLSNQQVVLLTGLAIITVAVLIALASLLVKLLRIPVQQIGVAKYMLIFSNSAFIGFPVTRAILGSDAVFYTAIINMTFYVLNYTYGIILIRNSKEKYHFRWSDVLTPMVVASLLSYVIYFIDFQAPAFLASVLQFMDQVSSPLSLLTIGCALAAVSFRNTMGAWKVYVALLVRMLAFPILYYSLLGLFITNAMILGVIVIIVAMPAPAGTAMLCASCGVDQSVASSGVFFSTLVSLVSIPLLSLFLLN